MALVSNEFNMSWHPQSRDASSKNSSNHFLQKTVPLFFGCVDRKFNGEKSLELAAFVPAATWISDKIGT